MVGGGCGVGSCGVAGWLWWWLVVVVGVVWIGIGTGTVEFGKWNGD